MTKLCKCGCGKSVKDLMHKGLKYTSRHHPNCRKRGGWKYFCKRCQEIHQNPSECPFVQKIVNKQHQLQKKSFRGEGNPFYGKHHSQETISKIQNNKDRSKKISFGVTKYWSSLSINDRRQILLPWFRASLSATLPNNDERLVYSILHSNRLGDFDYVGNGYTWIAGICPDFIDFKRKLIIEYNGFYTHSHENDIERRIKYHRYGYKTLFIYPEDLKDFNQIYSKVRTFLGE